LLLAYPFFELFERYAQPVGYWSYFLSPMLVMATSMIFEVLEWWATEILGEGQGAAYLGAQGDEWDAQKDMALATLGSFLTILVVCLL
jgi:putative membrane protein